MPDALSPQRRDPPGVRDARPSAASLPAGNRHRVHAHSFAKFSLRHVQSFPQRYEVGGRGTLRIPHRDSANLIQNFHGGGGEGGRGRSCRAAHTPPATQGRCVCRPAGASCSQQILVPFPCRQRLRLRLLYSVDRLIWLMTLFLRPRILRKVFGFPLV